MHGAVDGSQVILHPGAEWRATLARYSTHFPSKVYAASASPGCAMLRAKAQEDWVMTLQKYFDGCANRIGFRQP